MLSALLAVLACGAAGAGEGHCFDVLYTANSRATNALFKRRHLQGGGPTWAAILESEARRLMPKRAASLDFGDESDAVRICSSDPSLLATIRADYERLNKDAAALAKAIDRVPPDELE